MPDDEIALGVLEDVTYREGVDGPVVVLEGEDGAATFEIPDAERATDLADVAVDVEESFGAGSMGGILPDGGEAIEAEPAVPDESLLKPHPVELASAVAGDHVVVFGVGAQSQWQFELSGRTDADDLALDWQKIELSGDEVRELLLEGSLYEDDREDSEGTAYTLEIRGGKRHPKGSPIHMEDSR